MTGCELCGRVEGMRPFYPRLGILQCPGCELVFYRGPEVAETLYRAEYFAGGEYHDYQGDKAILQRNFRRRIADLLQLAPSGTLLEIGAAYGFFLELAQAHWRVRGLEISPDGAAHARSNLGLPVDHAEFLSLPDEPGSYDIICMWDTLEHLAHPVRYLEKIGRWLKPGGYLVLTTGDIASGMSRWRGDRWRLIHPPTHLFYFSPATLERAAMRAGLHLQRISHVGYYRSYRSMLSSLLTGRGSLSALLYRVATLGGRVDVPIYLNLHDIMMMVARKPA